MIIVVVLALIMGVSMVLLFGLLIDVVCRYQDRIDRETEEIL
jgi:hypothetical protein